MFHDSRFQVASSFLKKHTGFSVHVWNLASQASSQPAASRWQCSSGHIPYWNWNAALYSPYTRVEIGELFRGIELLKSISLQARDTGRLTRRVAPGLEKPNPNKNNSIGDVSVILVEPIRMVRLHLDRSVIGGPPM